MKNQPFICGEKITQPIPLEEFLPAYRSGVVSFWLNHLPSRPDLVIFPFGDSPLEALEAGIIIEPGRIYFAGEQMP